MNDVPRFPDEVAVTADGDPHRLDVGSVRDGLGSLQRMLGSPSFADREYALTLCDERPEIKDGHDPVRNWVDGLFSPNNRNFG